MASEKKTDKKYVETPLMKQYYAIKAVHPDANTSFGAAFDEKMEDEIRVTIIATGFDEKKGAGAITVSGGGAAGGSSKEKFNDLLLRPQTEEEKKAEEKDPFEDILRIFDR